jgi:hypothetical protein
VTAIATGVSLKKPAKKRRRARPKPPKIDVATITAMIAGIGGTSAVSAFGDSLDALMPGYGKKAVAVISILSFGAGLIVRTTSANRRTATAATTGEGPAPAATAPAIGGLSPA